MKLKDLLKIKENTSFFEKEEITVEISNGDVVFYLPNKTYIAVHKQQHGGYDGTIYLDTNISSFGFNPLRREFSEDDNIIGYIKNICLPLMKPLSDIEKYSYEEILEQTATALKKRNINFVFNKEGKIVAKSYYYRTYEEYYRSLPLSTFSFEYGGKKIGIGIQKSRGMILYELNENGEFCDNYFYSYMFNRPTVSGNQYVDELIKNFLEYEETSNK